jgi:serine/threonine-protein kinase
MSRVFVAREAGLDREVVVKVLSSDVAAGVSLERFTREIQLAASLQQANIVPLLSAGEANGVPYFTMPFVRGESLRGRLVQEPRLTISECVGILRDVARALSYAHTRGVVHRDIKPENVLLSHGAAVVTDFGIAKAVSASRTIGDRDTLTQVGTSLGTPAYMAPEQVAGDPKADHRADLYAWGCLAYELLSGEPPFVRFSPQQVLAAHLSEAPTPLVDRRADCPPALARLVMRCLAKDANNRPATADEVLRELDVVSTPAGSPSPNVSDRAERPLRRRIVLAISAAAVIGLTTFLMTRDRSAEATVAAAPDQSLAVLPLTNLSGDPADDYFGIGLAEEITRAVAKNGVRVIGRVSAGALLAKGLDERAVAKELRVGSLLTGTVQRDGGQVRINVSLLSATDGAVRWTEKYDRPLTNVFVLQDEIARSVATTLLGSLGVKSASHTRNETADPEAYTLFLQGQVLFNRRTAPTLQQAIELFQRAIARDPKYARAHASLAMSQTVLPNYVQGNSSTMLARATETAQRSIALDSTIAESYTALAYARAGLGENREAEEHFRHALALDSTVATTWGWYGLLANHLGDFATAHRRIARARELEPASLIARTWEAQVLIVERRFAAADSVAGATVALDSTFALAREARAEALVGLKRYDEAVSILERRLAELPPNRAAETHGLLAYAYARAGQFREARNSIATLRQLNGGRLPATGILAATLEELGDHEAAVALLGEAVAQHDVWLLQFNRSERYDKLRKDPRAAAMLASLEAR